MKHSELFASVLLAHTAFSAVPGIREIQRLASLVDIAEKSLNTKLRDLTEHVAQMTRSVSNGELYDRGAVMACATAVTLAEAKLREDLGRFHGRLAAYQELEDAFTRARIADSQKSVSSPTT